ALNELFIALNAIKKDPRYKRDGSNLEELVLDTLGHETIHAMRQADLFTQDEWLTLERAARKHVLPNTSTPYTAWATEQYSDLTAVQQMEEAIAEMTKDGMTGRIPINGRPKSLMRRMVEFLKGLFGIQDAVDYRTFDELVAGITSGEIATRAPAVRSLRETERMLAKIPAKDLEEKKVPAEDIEALANLARRGVNPAAMAAGAVPVTSQQQRAAAAPSPTTEETGQSQADWLEQRAYHGSPHRFDQFRVSQIGTGSGATMQGHGLYFAERKDFAEKYKTSSGAVLIDGNPLKDMSEFAALDQDTQGWIEETLREYAAGDLSAAELVQGAQEGFEPYQLAMEFAQTEGEITVEGGNLYLVDIDDAAIDTMIDWQMPMNKQPQVVQDAAREVRQLIMQQTGDQNAASRAMRGGRGMYEELSDLLGSQAAASTWLNERGIKGTRYQDGSQLVGGGFVGPLVDALKGDRKGTRNFVLFDETPITLLERNGEPVRKTQDMLEQRQGRLPMDPASRMQRAEVMGFDTTTPYYHGSKELFSEFKAKFPDGLIFFSSDPAMASKWGLDRARDHGLATEEKPPPWTAEEAAAHKKWRAETNAALSASFVDGKPTDESMALYEELRAREPISELKAERLADSMVYPVYLKKGNLFDPRESYKQIEPLLLSGDMPGTGWDRIVEGGTHKEGNWLVYENQQVVNRLKELGYGSMLIKESSLEGAPHNTVAVFDPSQVRSVNAAFDTSKAASADMLEQRSERVNIVTTKQEQQHAEQQRALERKRHTANVLISDRIARAAEESDRGRDAGVRFDRNRGAGRNGSLRFLAEYVPNDQYLSVLADSAIEPVTLQELTPTTTSVNAFHNAIEVSKGTAGPKRKTALRYGAAVYVYPKNEYRTMRLFMSPDGNYGFAIKKDGDIVSVFSDGGGKAYPMLALATQLGGTKLDAFDTILPRIYRVAGFREVGRDSWNEDYRPEGWDKHIFRKYNNGEPDVVYMEYDAAYNPYAEEDMVFQRQKLPTFITTTQKEKITNYLVPKTGTGAFDGGCYVCARAIQEVYGGELASLIRQDGVADHVVVKIGSQLVDADGALPEHEFVQDWIKKEGTFPGYNITEVRPFEAQDVPEALRSEQVIRDLVTILRTGKADTRKVMPREHDPAHIEKAVALNKSEDTRAGATYIPEFSTHASPEAQYIARNPQAGRKPDPEDLLFQHQNPSLLPGEQALLDTFITERPGKPNPLDMYNNITGSLETPSKLRYHLTKWKQAAINRYARLEELNVTGPLRENLADASSIASALHADRALGVVSVAMKYGTVAYENGIVHVKDASEGGGKSLREVMLPLYSPEYKNLTEVAQMYAIVQRQKRLVDENTTVANTAAERARVERMIQRFVDPATGENIIKRWYKDWQDFNEATITMMQKAGVLTEKTADLWREHADYYPFYKVSTTGGQEFKMAEKVFGGMTASAQLTQLKGSADKINMDMMEAISLNLTAAVQMSMKNIAQQRIVRDMVQLGLARQYTGGRADGPLVEFRVNGEKQRYEIFDPLIYESMLPLDGSEMVAMIRNTFGLPATALRELITRSPGFMMVNLLRDSLSAYATSGASLVPIFSTAKGLFDGVERLEKMGVVGGYDYGNDPHDMKKFWSKVLKQSGVNPDGTLHAPNMFMRLWDWAGAGTTASDAATRNAVFDDVFAKTGNLAEASFQAMEVINFGRRGRNPIFRSIGAMVPFLNARFQGLDVFLRAYTGRYTANKELNRMQATMSAVSRGALLTSMTALYYWLVSDDDQYKNASDYAKDNSWILPTPWGVPI
ncbi:MAG: hypothetical protein ACYSTZ_02145, partial [Planctomycetota bacterium]